MSFNPSTLLSPPASSLAAGAASSFPTGGTTNQVSQTPEPAAPPVKGNTMLLFLRNKMLQLKLDELTICRIAHVWAFGTDPDLTADAGNLRDHGVIPQYLKAYIKTLQ